MSEPHYKRVNQAIFLGTLDTEESGRPFDLWVGTAYWGSPRLHFILVWGHGLEDSAIFTEEDPLLDSGSDDALRAHYGDGIPFIILAAKVAKRTVDDERWTTAEALQKQKKLCQDSGSPFFARGAGQCSCGANVFQYPFGSDGAKLVTGCPFCRQSYCE